MVASAALMLREHGLTGTSFARVIDDADAPRGSIGHHFPGGKREMIAEAVRWAGAAATAAMRQAVERGDSTADVFSMICGVYRQALVETGFAAGCPVGAVAQEGYGDEALRASVAEVFDRWGTVLRESLRANGRDPEEAADLADLCVAAVEGALIICRVERSTTALDRVERRLLSLLG
ncbi:MAG: TetR/AcrR family transcriptional regulator [Solirubrobacterales bacterium]